MEIRSFLAFELPPEIRRTVRRISQEMKKLPLDVRWLKADNIHLTMVFLGNIQTDDLGPIGEAVSKACRRYRPFNVSLGGPGVFSGKRNPRVLWIRLEENLERMSYFRDALQKHLSSFGVKEEKRRFRPHLTIGRFERGARPGAHLDELLSRYQDLTSPVCTLGELILFRSDLKPNGAVYTKLKAWPLVGTH